MSEEQAQYNTSKNDQELYRRLSVPFATRAARDMAIEDFWGIVKSARVQCALSDVHLVVRTNHIDDEGVEQNGITSAHLGSSDAALNMLGYGYADALAVYGKFLESLGETAVKE